MPTYEYACKQCGQHLEVVQSFKDDPLTTCPHCEGTLRKVFSPVGIAFKGTGFYKTDSRSGAKAGASSSGGDTKGSGDASTSTSSGSSDSSAGSSSSGGSSSASSSTGSAPASKSA